MKNVLRSLVSLGMVPLLVLSTLAQVPSFIRIGVAGGVHGTVQAFPPGSAPGARIVGRVLKSGQPLYLGETISTDKEGSLQIMLLDETVFTIGPHSSMVLDEFVYDPEKGAGKVTAHIMKGVFRFVTGIIGHNKPADMKVKFPVGVAGIRGTIVAGEVSERTTTAVLLGPGPNHNAPGERVGAFSLENAGVKVEVVKPGYVSRIGGPNEAPSRPTLMSQAQINSLLGVLSQTSQASLHRGKSASIAAAPQASGGAQQSASASSVSPDQSEGSVAAAPQTSSDQSQASPAVSPDQTPASGGSQPNTAPSPDANAQAPATPGSGSSDSSASAAPQTTTDQSQSAPTANALPTGSGQTTATTDSGQGTAGASGDLSSTQDLSSLSNDLSNTQNSASNTIGTMDLDSFITANQSSWDDVRSIPLGTGQYEGTGDFLLTQCGGGSCADPGPHGSVYFLMNVDFQHQTIGGLSAAGSPSVVTVSAADSSMPVGISDSVQFNSQSYANLAGPAQVTGTSASGNLNATVSLLNVNSKVDMAAAKAVYNDGATSGSGIALGSRVDCTAGACH